jgi:hypothetical protein
MEPETRIERCRARRHALLTAVLVALIGSGGVVGAAVVSRAPAKCAPVVILSPGSQSMPAPSFTLSRRELMVIGARGKVGFAAFEYFTMHARA